MTNHIHLIASAKEGFHLSDIIRDFKKFTANQIIAIIKTNEESRQNWLLKRFEFAAAKHKRNSFLQIWTHENHAIELYTNEVIEQKLNYIHENPIRAGIVDRPEDYLYSSARNYADEEAIIEIDFL